MSKGETCAEIRIRREKEFAEKYPDGMPVSKGIWPWWLVRIWELKDDLKKSRASNFKLVSELVESDQQVMRLTRLLARWEKLDA